MFVLTKAAILETAQLVGIGSGLAKLDLMSFEMAQLKKQVEEINAKLDVILSAPLKLAVDFFGKAMRHMESENIAGVIKEMEKVKDHAMQAFRYAEGQGPKKNENLKNAVLAKQLVILSEIVSLMSSPPLSTRARSSAYPKVCTMIFKSETPSVCESWSLSTYSSARMK